MCIKAAHISQVLRVQTSFLKIYILYPSGHWLRFRTSSSTLQAYHKSVNQLPLPPSYCIFISTTCHLGVLYPPRKIALLITLPSNMAQTPSSPSAKAGKQAKKPEKSPAQLSKEIEDAFADVYNSFTTPKRQQLPQKWLEQVGSSYMAYKGGRASGLFVEGPGSGKDNTKYRATLMRMEALKGQITNGKVVLLLPLTDPT